MVIPDGTPQDPGFISTPPTVPEVASTRTIARSSGKSARAEGIERRRRDRGNGSISAV